MQPFALIRTKRIDRASELVAAEPSERELRAGGIDLLDRMKEGLAEPTVVVDLRELREPDSVGVSLGEGAPLLPPDSEPIARAPRYAHVAALTTLAELARAELPGFEALTEAAGQAATPGIRNTATVGGNLLQRPRCWYYRKRELVCLKKGGDACLAVAGDNRYNAILGGGPSFIVHPSSLATALLALGAAVHIHDLEPGIDMIALEDLFIGPKEDPSREHRLAPGQILTGISIPGLDDMRSAYQAVREKQSHDWPLVEAAARLRLATDGSMRDVRVALGQVAPIPWRAPQAEALLEGQTPSVELFAAAAEAALADAKPLGGNGYKVPMAKGLLREVLHRASGLALPE